MDDNSSNFSKDDDLSAHVDNTDRTNTLSEEKLVSRRAALLRIGLGVGAIVALASADHKAIAATTRPKDIRSNPNMAEDPSSKAENTGSSSSSSSSSGGIKVIVTPGGLDSTWTNSSVSVGGFKASVKNAPASSAWAAQWTWKVTSAPSANLTILPQGSATNATSDATLLGRFPNPVVLESHIRAIR